MKALLLILALSLTIQQKAATATATIYVYQTPHARMLKRAAPDVFCNGAKLAELDGGRYFVLHLPPGEYAFHSKNRKNGGAQLNVEAGETYYLRLEMEHTGYFLKFSGISVVQSEQGAFTVKQLRPIQEKYVKDPRVDPAYTEEKLEKRDSAKTP